MKTNTEFQLPVSELKSVLPGINKIISRRSTLPVLGCVRVEANAQGQMSLQATDLDDYATVTLKAGQPTQAGAFLVPWEPLAKAIKGSSTKESIVLVDAGKNGILLRTFIGNSPVDQKLDSPELIEWPPVPVIKETGILVEPELRQALQQALECSSEDQRRLILNTAYLDVSDKQGHYVVGTNARALFSANSFHFDLKESLVIPSRKFLHWSGLWEEEVCWLSHQPGKEHAKTKVKGDGWVQFKTDRWAFITKQVEGNYPNWRQIVPSASARTIIKLSQDALDSVLEVVPKLPGKDEVNSSITLLVANNHLQIQARSKTDELPTSIPIDGTLITGDSHSVSVNREYLLRALRFGLGEILLFDATENVMVCQSQGKRLIIAVLKSENQAAQASSSANPPPQPQNINNNERTVMTKATAATTAEASSSESSIKKVLDQIEKIKETLKGVVADFSEVVMNLKAAEKEKKATDKEIESVRASLRAIQNVKI